MKKRLKFLFPLPSSIAIVLFGFLLSQSEINGNHILFFDWLGMLMVFFIMFIIPFDILIWLFKSIYKKLSRKIYHEKNKNYLEEKSEAKLPAEVLDISKMESIQPVVLKTEINAELKNDIPTTNFDTESSEHASYPTLHPHLPPDNKSCNARRDNKSFDLESFMRECNAYVIKEDRKMRQEKSNAMQTASISENADQSLPKTPTYYSECNFDNMDGHEFEHFCASVLKKNGFESVDVTKGSGDQGIDIVAIKEGVKYGIQCKCYSANITNKAVQEVIAGKEFYNCHVGAVLTNRYFTNSAKELAEKTGILLWDREYLEKLIHNSNV